MPQPLSHAIAEEIGAPIARGDLKPGAILPTEHALSAQHSVSRTVVREALKLLASKGLLESRPRRGSMVQPRDRWNLFDPDVLRWIQKGDGFFETLAEFRRAVEPTAAELAALRASAEQVQLLAELCDEMEAAEAARQHSRFHAADQRFHDTLSQASGNAFLRQTFKTIEPLIRVSLEATLHLLTKDSRTVPLHRKLADAIAQRDPSSARQTMERIIDYARDHTQTPTP